jgi:hypothetical protein
MDSCQIARPTREVLLRRISPSGDSHPTDETRPTFAHAPSRESSPTNENPIPTCVRDPGCDLDSSYDRDPTYDDAVGDISPLRDSVHEHMGGIEKKGVPIGPAQAPPRLRPGASPLFPPGQSVDRPPVAREAGRPRRPR